MKKLMIGVFAALCGTTVWAMRTVSLVSLDDGQARLAFSGWTPKAIGWIDTVYLSKNYRCWIVDDRRGLVLIVR